MSAKQNIGILVGEPCVPVANIIAKILADNGYRKIAYSTDRDEIFVILKKRETDIALLDFDLAVADRFELIDRIATDRELYHLPLLLMGRGASAAMVAEALRLGGRDYINKPFTPYLLMVRIEKILFGPREPIRRTIFKEKGVNGPDATHPELTPRSEHVTLQIEQARKLYEEGLNLLELRKYDRAIAKFAAAVRVHMLYPEAYVGLAEAFRGQGNLERWGQFMSKAAETCAWLDRDAAASDIFAKTRKLDATAPNPFKTVADHMAGQRNASELERLYTRALELDPHNDAVRLALARVHMEAGRRDEAAGVLSQLSSRGDVPEELRELVLSVTRADARATASTGARVDFIETAAAFDGPEKRRVKRIPLAEYAARLPQREQNFHMIDASALGVSFKHGGESFEIGEELVFDLVSMSGVKVRKMGAVVRRVTPLVVGCELQGLSQDQKEQYAGVIPCDESGEGASG
ncbi:DNA-binding response OmpR family regulator [Desulfobaculum xiamenense]|uniref:DNA-binding response OmpR family regulator n=1 Tax=Desulfobaculum xiamenense TaxID=995050 RepID=A0A846QH60_9BACT|nr:tetratricopeptide repeat protein [Desulfobaculum xiamenense]NJB67618.1 DNA-binding response OmpR family regulator [Desulfobaculum xiamenense]